VKASGDIRNVAKSLAGLPVCDTGRYEIVANDRDFDIVARNVILLLMPLRFDRMYILGITSQSQEYWDIGCIQSLSIVSVSGSS
jgi:hypothetical protein